LRNFLRNAFSIHRVIVALAFGWLWWGFYLRKMLYFRDYSIIWEGTFRLFQGQMPFRDFGLPMGPGALILPTAAFHLFGTSFQSLVIVQFLIATTSLILFLTLFNLIGIPKEVSAFATLLISLYFSSATQHPWYNTTAIFYELLSIVLLITYFRKHQSLTILVCSYALAVMAVFTKQDFGALTVLIYCFVLVYNFVEKRTYQHLKPLIFLAILTIVFLAYYSKTSDLLYWFNYGQSPHISRTDSVKLFLPMRGHDHLGYMPFLILWGGLFLYRARKKTFDRFPVLLSLLFIFQCMITYQSSGLNFLTSTYYVGFAFILAFNIANNSFKNSSHHSKIKKTILIFSILAIPSPFSFKTYLQWIQDKTTDFKGDVIGYPTSKFEKKIYPSLSGEYFNIETIDSLSKLEKQLVEIRSNQTDGDCFSINMTELTPLDADLKLPSCTGMPIWFHTNISFFPREVEVVSNNVLNRKYSLIFIQWTHEQKDPTYTNLLKKVEQSEYQLLAEIPSPAEYAPIYIFKRK